MWGVERSDCRTDGVTAVNENWWLLLSPTVSDLGNIRGVQSDVSVPSTDGQAERVWSASCGL